MARFSSTKEPLAANGTWTSGSLQVGLADRITGSVYSDVAGTLFVEQSGDNTNWDISKSIAVGAGVGVPFSEELVLPYARLRYVNGAGAQSEFRVFARQTSAGPR